MTIELIDAVNFEGLFDILGKGMYAIKTLNTARLTTVPTEVNDFILQYKKKTTASNATNNELSAISTGLVGWQDSGAAITSPIVQFMVNYLIEIVKADSLQPDYSLQQALEYLIADIIAQAYYVDPNAVSIVLAAGAGNTSNDLVVLYTHKRGDGKVQENTIAETINLSITGVTGNLATIRIQSDVAVDLLSQDWPDGSGVDTSISSTHPSSSLLTNGNLQDQTVANIPDEWIPAVGAAGTRWTTTAPEQQTVGISGSPASGAYYLKWVNPAGIERATDQLNWDATAADVQAALRGIPGLEDVTVTATGTSPNYTHTVVFTGVAGNINTMTSVSQLNTGSISHAQTVAGSDNCYEGSGLLMVGDSSTLSAIYHRLPDLETDTVYFLFWRHKKTATPAAGTIRWAIVDEIAGGVLNDSAGNANSATYDLTTGAVTTSFAEAWFAFRIAPTAKQPIWIQVIATTAVSTSTSYCFDEVALVKGQELYPGGPFINAISGKTPPATTDVWTLTPSNDRASEWQEWFNRAFQMADKGLLLPVAGSTLLNDSLIG